METAEHQSIFESSIEMQKETLSRIIETGKKVTEMYTKNYPFKFMIENTPSNLDTFFVANPKVFKDNMLKSAKILSKNATIISKYQRERVKLFTKTQMEWLQNSELTINKQWVEKFVEMNDTLEKAYVEFGNSLNSTFQNGFESFIEHVEENFLQNQK